MKKLLFFFALLAISYSVLGQDVSYLPANPQIVKCKVIPLKKSDNRRVLIKILGIYEPITTRVTRVGAKTFYEPVNINGDVNLGIIKVNNLSKDSSRFTTKKATNLIIKSFLGPRTWQTIALYDTASSSHPLKYGWLKKQFKWHGVILNGYYQDKQLVWKGHDVTLYQTETDWVLISALIVFLLLLPLPVLMDTDRFKRWLETNYCGSTIEKLTIWFSVILAISLAVLLFCQIFVFSICATLICASFFHEFISENIKHYWSIIFQRKKQPNNQKP